MNTQNPPDRGPRRSGRDRWDILRLQNGKPVGKISAGVAVFSVGAKNFFRSVGGYSLDAGALSQAEKAGCHAIEFDNRDTGEVARVSLAAFQAHAVRLKDFGYGVKLCCPASCYDSEDRYQLGLFPDFGGAQAQGAQA